MSTKKAFTTTTIKTRLNYEDAPRKVGVTSGRGGISMWIGPDPTPLFDSNRGTTNLTPEQARQLAQDLIERADEIEARS